MAEKIKFKVSIKELSFEYEGSRAGASSRPQPILGWTTGHAADGDAAGPE
jgi:hypothetical protein